MTKTQFENLILGFFPQPIARIYSTVQGNVSWMRKVQESLRLFEFGLRYFTLLAASQYLYRTKGVSDAKVDSNLLNFLQVGQKSLGPIQETLFSLFKIQKGQREQFFIKEMYDWYWDTSYSPHRQRRGVGTAFNQLIELRNEIIHYKVIPQSDEEWREYFFRIEDLLNKSLGTLTFLEQYRLVRVEDIKSEMMVCKDFTGLSPDKKLIEIHIHEREKIPSGGWLCISKLQPDYLQVHPLIVFLQGEDVDGKGNIALLENFDAREAVYIQPQFGNIQLVDIIGDLFNFVRGVLEERIGKLIEYDTLTWVNFRGASNVITTQKTSLLQSKYDEDVYLQRQSTKVTFDDFLASNKTSLVLIGNSGIGKSSFLTSIIREYSNDEQSAIIAYDGANLDPSQSLNDSIENDLRSLIRRRKLDKVSILDDLPLRTNIEGKKLIILIDAINENGSPRDLLVSINRFIVDYNRYSWIKVVITSRPQAWRMMKRGVKLADSYYYYPKDALDPWLEMLPFSWQEVSQVYKNYQTKYELKTGFEDLAPEIKANLRDPLFLQLVSRTWKRLKVPSRISTFDVYKKYLDTLIEDEMVRPNDLDLLEFELMPNFIDWDKFSPSIPRHRLQHVKTKDGRPLLELVENRDYAGDTPINISFVHLVDVGLLEQRGSPRDYEIRFKFERFFDYFVGKRLYEIVKLRGDTEAAYQNLLQETLHNPWLWGGVKNALILELQSGQFELVRQLIHTEDSYLKDLIVVVLEEYGEEARADVSKLLLSILTPKRKRGKEKTLKDQIAGKGAIEAAYRLNFVDVLETGCFDADSAIRSVAIQQLWRYWSEKGREDGFQAIERIVAKSTKFPRIMFDGLESGVSISLLILFQHSTDSVVTSRLMEIWRPIFKKLLLDSSTRIPIITYLQSLLRNSFLLFAGVVFQRLTRSTEDVKYWFNFKEVANFISLNDREKSLCLNVLKYMDTEFDDLEVMYDDIIQIGRTNSVVAWFLIVCVFVPQARVRPTNIVTLTKRVFDELVGIESPPPAIVLPTDVFAYGIDNRLYQQHPEWLELFRDITLKFISSHKTTFNSNVTSYQYLMSEVYCYKYYQTYQSLDESFQEKYLELVLSTNDTEFIRSYTRSFAVGAVLRIPPRISMAALLPIIDIRNQHRTIQEKHKYDELLVEALSIVRNFKPNEVDDFMLENDIDILLQQQVKANTIEKLGNVLGLSGTRFIMESYLVHPSKERREFMQRIFEDAINSRSTSQWAPKFMKRIINTIYGKSLF